jgi:hypothetical protein
MKLLKAIEKEKLNIKVILRFDKDFDVSDFNLGTLNLERKGRSLYLDVIGTRLFRNTLVLFFEYDPEVLKDEASKECDLKVEDLILGLDTCELDVDFQGKVLPYEQNILVEGGDADLEIGLKIK